MIEIILLLILNIPILYSYYKDNFTYAYISYFSVIVGGFLYSLYIFINGDSIVQPLIIIPILSFLSYIFYNKYPYEFRSLSKFITFSSIIFILGYFLSGVLIDIVISDTVRIIRLFGIDVTVDSNKIVHSNGLATRVVLSCTAIETIAIITGFISTLKIDDYIYKISVLILSISIIHILNIIRNVFISISYGYQLFNYEILSSILKINDTLTSYYVADYIISQPLSIVAIFLIIVSLHLYVAESKLIDEFM